MDPKAKDLATLEYATPAMRTALAFALFLRFGSLYPFEDRLERAYAVADAFIAQLKEDYSED